MSDTFAHTMSALFPGLVLGAAGFTAYVAYEATDTYEECDPSSSWKWVMWGSFAAAILVGLGIIMSFLPVPLPPGVSTLFSALAHLRVDYLLLAVVAAGIGERGLETDSKCTTAHDHRRMLYVISLIVGLLMLVAFVVNFCYRHMSSRYRGPSADLMRQQRVAGAMPGAPGAQPMSWAEKFQQMEPMLRNVTGEVEQAVEANPELLAA